MLDAACTVAAFQALLLILMWKQVEAQGGPSKRLHLGAG